MFHRCFDFLRFRFSEIREELLFVVVFKEVQQPRGKEAQKPNEESATWRVSRLFSTHPTCFDSGAMRVMGVAYLLYRYYVRVCFVFRYIVSLLLRMYTGTWYGTHFSSLCYRRLSPS